MANLPEEFKKSITTVGLKSYIVWEKCSYGHVVFRFRNNYGASVIRHEFSYGGTQGFFELAVLEWIGEDYKLTYTTPVADDVIGYLTGKDVEEILSQIKKLPVLLPLDKSSLLE